MTTCTTIWAPLTLLPQNGATPYCVMYVNTNNSCIDCNFHLLTNTVGLPWHMDCGTANIPNPTPYSCNGMAIWCTYLPGTPATGAQFRFHY